MENFFELSKWAHVCAFGPGNREQRRVTPLCADENGNITLLPAESEKPEVPGNTVWQLGFEWEEPRDVRSVSVKFADGFGGTSIDEMYVQYWMATWPMPAQEHRAGALRGWAGTDDPFNGHFAEAYGEIKVGKTDAEMVFDHIDITEVPDGSLFAPGGDIFSSDDFDAYFRRTLKLRVLFSSKEAPVVAGFSVVGDNTVVERECEITFADPAVTLETDGISVYNGKLLSAEKADGVIKVKYTAVESPRCDGDKTSLQFNVKGGQAFSAYSEDIENGVYMSDFGMLIRKPDGKSADEKIKSLTEGKKSIYDRVPEEREQTLERAFAEIPEMDVTKQQPYGRYVILGWEGLRKKFCLRYNGDIFADKGLQKSARRDLKDTRWAGMMLHYRLMSGDPPTRRENRDDCRQYMPDASVPVYVTEWTDREIEYRQTSFCIPRDTSLVGKDDLRGDEDVLILNRVEIRNAADTTHVSRFYIEPMPQEKLIVENGRLIATGRVQPDDTVHCGWRVHDYAEKRMRLDMRIEKGELRTLPSRRENNVTFSMRPGEHIITSYYDGRRGEFEAAGSINTALLYEVELAPYETVSMDYAVPYNTPVTEDEMAAVRAYGFDECLEKVQNFWHEFYAKAAKIDLPEDKTLNDFVKAVPWHITMTAMREPVSGNYIVPAGTYAYSACGNEACMQIRLMDYLGYHSHAEKYLETYAVSQGMNGLDGNFKSKEGAFFAINYGGRGTNDDEFSYNLDHGYILECFADHYFLTGDREWLSRMVQTLIDGCDFVFREREATKQTGENGEKVSYFGLLPHGHLEDNNEWRCWFAVNAHACGGIYKCARALEEIGHPEAARLLAQCEEYRADIRDCVIRATAGSPAVPDGRGGYMPHVPTRCEIRGRDLGWFREAAYGPLHLLEGDVITSDDPLTEWILRDLEDNLFISRDWGRIADKEKYWFSRGGITIQSNLLFNDIVYLKMSEPKRAVRALFNNFAQNLYRDMSCFTEHPVPEFGHGIGPFFKTPDESQFLCNLRNHLIREDGETLHLLQGAPQAWFEAGKTISFDGLASNFGAVSLKCESGADGVSITVEAKWRNAPQTALLSVRDAQERTPVSVEVKGGRLLRTDGDVIIIEDVGERIDIAVDFC